MKKIIALGNFPQNLAIPGVTIEHYPQRYLSAIGSIREQLEWLRSQQADGYIGTNDIAALKAAIATGNQTQIRAMLAAQNKYSARRIINQASNGEGYIELAHNSRQSTGFIKPVRSSLSFAAAKFQSNDEIRYHVSRFKSAVAERNTTFKELAVAAGADDAYITQIDSFVVESLIDLPDQCTVDGFVQNGKVTIIGATKSVLHENNFSFIRFDFPMHVQHDILLKLHTLTEQAVIALGLDNTTFNCELRFDTASGAAAIIEINTRMSMQFRPLYLAVTGWDIASVAVQIAAGLPVRKSQIPAVRAASIHILRHHSDEYILSAPTPDDIRGIEAKHPKIKISSFVRQYSYLSDTPQDGMTYRYAQVFMPEKGSSIRSALRLANIKHALNFTFESNSRYIKHSHTRGTSIAHQRRTSLKV